MGRSRIAVLVMVLAVTALLLPSSASAWGEQGHRLQARLLMDTLPAEMRDFFAAAGDDPIADRVMYPDSFDRFDAELLGEQALQILERHDIPHRYALHSHAAGGRGPAASFILLTRAFQEDDPHRAAIWAGSLMHAVGDDFGANHGPLIHYLTYAFGPQSIEMGDGIGLDFGNLDSPEGRQIVADILDGYEPAVVSDDPAEVLEQIMIAGYRNAAFMTRRERAIAATYAEDAAKQAIAEGRRALAELGTEAIKQVADLIVTAHHLAEAGVVPELDDATINAAHQRTQQFLDRKPLWDDSIYVGLLEPAVESPAIGVVLEPTHNFNEGVFRSGTRYILASIMRELQRAELPYRPLDVRRLGDEGLPDPDDVPVIIVCAGSFAVDGPTREAFEAYADAGGCYLWIGGRARDYGNTLGPLGDALAVAEPDLRPVTSEYGADHLDVIENLTVRFHADLAEQLGDDDRPFVMNPNTPAGWQKPVCDLHVITDNPAIRKLGTITDSNRTITVAAALMDDDAEQDRHVFVPEYLLAPYLLSGEDRLSNPAEPELDRVGRRVLLGAVELLRGSD